MAVSYLEGFEYRDGVLHCEDVDLESIARQWGTPLYVYSASAIEQKIAAVKKALDFGPHLITYAVKANDNLSILRLMAVNGLGADTVSEGEIRRALMAGVEPANIVFSGVGKKPEELRFAMQTGIRSINVESQAELEAIIELSESIAASNSASSIAIRVNPEVDPVTHPYITTGLKNSKFGVTPQVAREMMHRLKHVPSVKLTGLTAHIGSMMLQAAPLEHSVKCLVELANEARALGHSIASIDAGGGWGVDHGKGDQPIDATQAFGDAIRRGLESVIGPSQAKPYQLVVELGRHLIANAAVLLTEVVYTKAQDEKNFVIVDAAITELLRPTLYQAYHHILPVRQVDERAHQDVDIVGPVCESGDFFAKERGLQAVNAGEHLVICSAGAYASVMSSHYNARPHPAHVMVRGYEIACIRQRETYEDLWKHELQAQPFIFGKTPEPGQNRPRKT